VRATRPHVARAVGASSQTPAQSPPPLPSIAPPDVGPGSRPRWAHLGPPGHASPTRGCGSAAGSPINNANAQAGEGRAASCFFKRFHRRSSSFPESERGSRCFDGARRPIPSLMGRQYWFTTRSLLVLEKRQVAPPATSGRCQRRGSNPPCVRCRCFSSFSMVSLRTLKSRDALYDSRQTRGISVRYSCSSRSS
jgi:hypothetical protein